MKILKQGNAHLASSVKVTCNNCNSELEYTKKDIQFEPRDGDFIICPVCEQFIGITDIMNKQVDRRTDC